MLSAHSNADLVEMQPTQLGCTEDGTTSEESQCRKAFVLCTAQAATAMGVQTIVTKGADQKDSKAEHGLLDWKQSGATPVPTETILVPVDTVPAVAVSGTGLQPHILLCCS